MRTLIFAGSALGMLFFAYIAWQYNVIGGTVFTTGAADLKLWALTFLALTALLCVLVVGITVADAWHKKAALVGFSAVLVLASVVGATAGRIVDTAKQDGATLAAQQQAADLRRQAASIEAAANAKRASLEVAGVQQSSGVRAAAQSKLDALQADYDRAAALRAQGNALIGSAAVSSGDILGRFTTPFIVLLSLCIELGCAFFAHVCAGLYCGEIRNAFNNLRSGGDDNRKRKPQATASDAPVYFAPPAPVEVGQRPHTPAPAPGLRVVKSGHVDGSVLQAMRLIQAEIDHDPALLSDAGTVNRMQIRKLIGSTSAVDKAVTRWNRGERPPVAAGSVGVGVGLGIDLSEATA
jgi:hypothetical protein